MKFKVIEKDRFLKMEEMGKVKGGGFCTPSIGFRGCDSSGYITCKVEVSGASVYYSGPCESGAGLYITCSGSMTYRNCIIGNSHMICMQGYEGEF